MNFLLKLGVDLALAVLFLHFSLTSCAPVESPYKDDDWSNAAKIYAEDPWDRLNKWTVPTIKPFIWPTFRPYTLPPWKPHHNYRSSDDTSLKLAIFLPIVFVSLLILACKVGIKNCSDESTYTSRPTVHAPPRQPSTFTSTPGVHRNGQSSYQNLTTEHPSPRTLRLMLFARGNSHDSNISSGLGNVNNSMSTEQPSPRTLRQMFARGNAQNSNIASGLENDYLISSDNDFSPFDRPPDYSTVIINDLTNQPNFPEVKTENTPNTPPPLYDENKWQRFE